MRFPPPFSGVTFAILLLAAACVGTGCVRSAAPADVGWHHYGRDHSNSKYSEASQINRDNVGNLEIAWRWESPDRQFIKRPSKFIATPLMVNGLLYLVTGAGIVEALDPASGETVWSFDPEIYKDVTRVAGAFKQRGIEYWTDGDIERIIVAMYTSELISIDARTGAPDTDFGKNGRVDLTKGLGRPVNRRQYSNTSPPIVTADTVIVGSSIWDVPNTLQMAPGHVRGYDVRTGEMKWIFHTIPQEDEFGNETWENGSWKYTGNTNVWGIMSADDALGYVYLPVSTPTNDHYGGHRLGDNLFGDSLVCLDARTGQRIWHFQTVHHGLWDYDLTAAPNLVDIVVDGRAVRAVAQVTKSGFCFVFDRETGDPVWPIEERPVPQSTVPGERSSPTQPIPTRPPPFETQGITEDDLIDFTPELRERAKAYVDQFVHGPLYTPPSISHKEGTKGTLVLPGPDGGASWGGAGFDPDTGILYIPSKKEPIVFTLGTPDSNLSQFKYSIWADKWEYEKWGSELPLLKPPYSKITAMDLNAGKILWQVPLGDGPVNHPRLKSLNLSSLGTVLGGFVSRGVGGPLVTKSLVFIGSVEVLSKQSRTAGLALGTMRAYTKDTGELAWEYGLNTPPHGNPMTYVWKGKQYLVVAAGGDPGEPPGELIAFAVQEN